MTDISYKKSFQKEYRRLNQQQKQAVDAIDGPVMVIAGAGTGKTQTIALRIANILLKTDTPPHSILCLTFTDNAAFNMRLRLLSIIGPTAYSVQINTFHSFCNSVIQSNPDKFEQTKLTPIEDIDKIEIISKIIEKLPHFSSLKPSGESLYYLPVIISAIQTLKREGYLPKSFQKLLDSQQKFIDNTANLYQQLKSLRLNKNFEAEFLQIFKTILTNKFVPDNFKNLFSQKYQDFQKGFYQKGKAKNPAINFKNDIISIFDQLIKNLPKQIELQKIYRQYQIQLKKLAFYDFDDMINFVIQRFKKDNDFLKIYQEQIQYILVDEFQDSNNSQIRLLGQLASYFTKPNLFVVGDDDQSIFRFQGASVENIINFYYKYQPQVFVLKNNYRSHQLILDSAGGVISKNQLKLINHIKDIDKSLISQVNYDPDPINLFQAQTPVHEAVLVVDKISQLLKSGQNPEDMAILYRQHSDVDLIEKLLISHQIKYTRTKQNSFNQDYISFFLRILLAISNPNDDFLIYSFLCLPFLKIPSLLLIKILHQTNKLKVSLTDYLYSSKLKSTKIKTYLRYIADCQIESQNLPLDRLFVYIIKKFSYLKYLNGLPNSYQAISDFYNLFAYLKSFQKIHPDAVLSQFVNRLKLLQSHNLSLPQSSSSTPPKDYLCLQTVHGAKGLEYDFVFIINCIDGRWGNCQSRNSLPLPLGIVKSGLTTDLNEEDRRLFYVALTRAKKQIYLSYSQTRDNGKNQSPSQFIYEIDPKNIDTKINQKAVSATDLENIMISGNSSQSIINQNKEFIENYLKTSYKLNITHLNSYLSCPYCFFYKTILKIPSVKSAKASLGTAIHSTLAYLHLNPQTPFKKLNQVFKINLLREILPNFEYKYMFGLGQDILKKYLKDNPDLSGKYQLELNFYGQQVFLDNIPLTGKIDKIEILPTFTAGKSDIIVTDFKTGKFNSQKISPKFDSSGGQYFRQILFYKLLLDLSPRLNFNFKSGQIEYLEPDPNNHKFTRAINFTQKDMDNFKTLIKQTYQNILDLKFPINPTCKNRDHLHQL